MDKNKLDSGKYMAGVIEDFAPALKEVAKLGSMNNKPFGKYERGSWKLVEQADVRYKDAFWRHLLEGPHSIDHETGMPHDVAIAWNALALVCIRLKREASEATLKNEDDKKPRLLLGCAECNNSLLVNNILCCNGFPETVSSQPCSRIHKDAGEVYCTGFIKKVYPPQSAVSTSVSTGTGTGRVILNSLGGYTK